PVLGLQGNLLDLRCALQRRAPACAQGLRRAGISRYDFSLRRLCVYSASSARANNSSIEQGLVGSKRTTPTLKAKAQPRSVWALHWLSVSAKRFVIVD